jgi:hypothetical protein
MRFLVFKRVLNRFLRMSVCGLLFLPWLALGWVEAAKKPVTPIQVTPSPVMAPETQPVYGVPANNAPLSVDSPANIPDYVRYEPYNTFPRELDLWNLEGRRLIQSPPVVAPDKSAFVYTEVMFTPDDRQTYSKLFWVPVTPLPQPPLERLPSEAAQAKPEPPVPFSTYAARFDPRKTTRIRKAIADVGFHRVSRFDFRTLTVVDWSYTGNRLLFKERSGVLHLGVRTTNILIYDQAKGTVTIYPEVQRIIQHYWTQHGNLGHIEKLSWDIQPLGWAPNSDDVVLMKAWAYDLKEKKFLGLWRYDVSSERTQLLSLSDTAPAVAANGWLPSPVPPPPEAAQKRSLKERIRHPFSYDNSASSP